MKNFKHLLFLSILCSLVLFTNCGDSDDPVADDTNNTTDNANDGSNTDNGETETLIYLDENGVTIKATSDAVIGESYELSGVSYLVVDSAMLYEMVAEEEDVTKVVTSKVTNMDALFADMNFDDEELITFNQDISAWDVSNVTYMRAMFFGAVYFNQDIGFWDVGNVTNMADMFFYNVAFNQDIDSWDVSNVTIMRGMFSMAEIFNQDLSSWDVANVTNCLGFCSSGYSNSSPLWTLPKPNFTNCSTE